VNENEEQGRTGGGCGMLGNKKKRRWGKKTNMKEVELEKKAKLKTK